MKIFLLVPIFFLLNACSSSSKKPVSKLYYRFDQASLSSYKKQGVLIKRPSASGILGNRPMVAQNIDGALIQMSHNFWLESPKTLLYDYLNKIFNGKVTENNLTLNSQILQLEKKKSSALLSIKFTLTNKDNNVILEKTYQHKSILKTNTIASFVKAITDMLNNQIQQFIKEMP